MIKKYLNLIDCEEYDIKIINDEKIFYELLLNSIGETARIISLGNWRQAT